MTVAKVHVILQQSNHKPLMSVIGLLPITCQLCYLYDGAGVITKNNYFKSRVEWCCCTLEHGTTVQIL